MQSVYIKEILDFTKGRLVKGNPDTEIKEFSLDSRTVVRGDLFIAIKGERFDGHQFLRDAIKRGAIGIIVRESFELPKDLPDVVIKVKDTIKALGDIARIYRARFTGPVVAVTGTVGKTTTKEFIATVLQEKFCVHKTQDTLNNHIGVPMTIWKLEPRHEVGVIELGMSGFGEIEYLAKIAQPDVGVITNIGPAHLEQLGSIENVLKSKAELLSVMGGNGLVVLNRDDKYFEDLKKRTNSRLVTIGKHNGADYQAVNITVSNNGSINCKVIAKPYCDILELSLPVIGLHNVYSALFAIAIGYGLGMAPDDIINGLGRIKLPKMRLEWKEIAGIRIIDDCYNANPISMAGALETLSLIHSAERKIFVCSDMLELGEEAENCHRELGRKVADYGIHKLITIGTFSKFVSDTAIECGLISCDVHHCMNNMEAVEILSKWIEPGDVILVKGSRANKMEEITKGIEEYYGTLDKLIV